MMLFKARKQSPEVSGLAQRDTKKSTLVLVSLFCADDATIAKSVRFHIGRRYRTIFVTTTMNYGLFRAAGAVGEVFPAPDWPRGSQDDFAFSLYLKERWRVVLTKWVPDFLVNEGLEFSQYLRKMVDTPEDSLGTEKRPSP